MGARGPLPKGRKPALKFAPGVPPPPAWLDATARAEYARVVEELAANPDHLQQVDMSVISTYAQAYSDVCRLTRDVRKEGETLVSATKGTSYLNPKVGALSAAYNRMREAAAKLAFSPVDRMRMSGKGGGTGKKGTGELDAFV